MLNFGFNFEACNASSLWRQLRLAGRQQRWILHARDWIVRSIVALLQSLHALNCVKLDEIVLVLQQLRLTSRIVLERDRVDGQTVRI